MNAYHEGRQAAQRNMARTPPFDQPKDGDNSPLAPYSAWLRGFDDRAAEKAAKKAATKRRAAERLQSAQRNMGRGA